MTRQFFIERALRQIYGGQPTDDSQITVNLVNSWLNDAIATAAKQCYKEGTSLPDKTQGLDHMNDALGYLISFLYPITRDFTATTTQRFTVGVR